MLDMRIMAFYSIPKSATKKNKELMRVLKQYEPKGNPAKIVGLADANECLRALEAVEPLKEGKNE